MLYLHVGLSAVSLAYYNKKDLQFGVIYNPFTEETFYAVRGQGAFLNGRAIHVAYIRGCMYLY